MRNTTLGNQDTGSEEDIRKEVAKLLHLYDFSSTVSLGGIKGQPEKSEEVLLSAPSNPSHSPRISKQIVTP